MTGNMPTSGYGTNSSSLPYGSLGQRPQLTENSYIKDIPYRCRRNLCMQLDVNDKWRSIVGMIPEYPNSPRPRYGDLHIETFQQETRRSGGSPADKMLRDWQTQMPTIGDLIQLLLAAELISVANFLREDVLDLDPIQLPAVVEHPLPLRADPHMDDVMQPPHLLDPAPSPPGPVSSAAELPTPSLHVTEVLNSVRESLGNSEDVTQYTYAQLSSFTNEFDSTPLSDGGRLLGKGGYGEVFFGKDPSSGANVELLAVKRFHESSLEHLKQFQKELSFIAKCRHDNLLRITGVCCDTRFCVIYEYMDGHSLQDRLEKYESLEMAPLTAAQRISVAVSVARGIHYLHSQSDPIVHRDVKSANILLTKDAKAKLGDFGLMRVHDAGAAGDVTSNITTTIHGSTLYMPPECLRSARVSPKWDVYSLGVVLLELLLGKGPAHVGSNGFHTSVLEYVVNGGDDDEEEGEAEFQPLSLVDPAGDWPTSVSVQLIELAVKCGAKYSRRPYIDEVLDKLVQLEKELPA